MIGLIVSDYDYFKIRHNEVVVGMLSTEIPLRSVNMVTTCSLIFESWSIVHASLLLIPLPLKRMQSE